MNRATQIGGLSIFQQITNCARANRVRDRRVLQHARQREHFDVEDFAAGMIRFRDGSVLVLETSWLGFQSEDELMRVQCFGDTSGLIWPEGVLVGETDRVPWTIRLDKSDERSGFDEQMLRFATAVRDGLASPVPVEQTRTVIRILEGLDRSAQAKREVEL